MQAIPPQMTMRNGRFGRNLGLFLTAPLAATILLALGLAITVANYQSQHNGRIFTGISVWGVDLSQMSIDEAQVALANAFPYPEDADIVFTDPGSNEKWVRSPADLGMTFDVAMTVDTAFEVGRTGGTVAQIRQMFESWYYGRSLAPILVFDQGQLDTSLAELAAEVYRPPANVAFDLNGETARYEPAQVGRILDVENTRSRLLMPLTDFRQAEIQLLIHEIVPPVQDSGEVIEQLGQIANSPVTFYLQEPLDEFDLMPVTLPVETLISWLRLEVSENVDGSLTHQIFIDENAIRHWLSQFEDQIHRDPVNARFYFDDNTRELVLVAPHVNGRELDLDATAAQFMAQVKTANRSVLFVVNEIVPVAHSQATAVDLGITELITEATTWFYGSSDARKHNIATSAANFYGIVVNPYEEFSFNKYLGSISEADGYEAGLIIVDGLTIEGIGGGICQVSTTLYQTAFFAGFPITERLPHGYMLGYYRDGAGHGMDATIYSPLVDMKFLNNTPHHLLIENYYNEEFEALTFKFYSTSMGRTVVKEDPVITNVTEVPTGDTDKWVFNENMEPGTVEQVDWATEGADVSIRRIVYNANGDLLEDRVFASHYIPVSNVYHYGPGVEAGDYSLIPDNN